MFGKEIYNKKFFPEWIREIEEFEKRPAKKRTAVEKMSAMTEMYHSQSFYRKTKSDNGAYTLSS